MSGLVEIAFPLPVDGTFTYQLPEDLRPISLGRRVLAPFHRRELTGYVVGFPSESKIEKLKTVTAVLDDDSILTEDLLSLARHMAGRYNCPLGQVLQVILPPGLIRQTRRKVIATPKEGLPSDSSQGNFLRRLRKGKGLDLLTLLRKEKGMAILLREMEKEGWIETQNILQLERANEQSHNSYRCTESTPGDSKVRGSKRKLILDFLRKNGGEAFEEELRNLSGNVRLTLNQMVNRGLLERRSHMGSGPLKGGVFDSAPRYELNEAQASAYQAILAKVRSEEFHPFLLHGITGSGKTEVYLRVAEEVVRSGKNVIALVPEISLTPQFVGRFRARFGSTIAVLHSGRSEGDRLTEWKRIRSGSVRVVIGARSAVFAPIENLGLMIVDEEHDPSYKQDEGLRYSGLEIAKYRARNANAVLVLGSATPSLETYQSAREESIVMLHLPHRATGQKLPEVQVVDVRKQISKYGDRGLFSSEMIEGVTETLVKGEQAILFLNRRGFAPVGLCPTCGEGLRCQNCSVALTYHEKGKVYLCHYCDFVTPRDQARCACGQDKLIHIGFGTEKVEEELRHRFPDARIERMDRDTVRKRGDHERLLQRLAQRKIDILVGTQMVTKGLDLPMVTLVGVLLADQGLHFPDFRAAERTFQLITQVVGRSGRSDHSGRAIIQTFHPDHYVLQTAAKQDYLAFFEKEIGFRKDLRYPPFSHLTLIEIQGKENAQVRKSAIWLGEQARKTTTGQDLSLDVLGPAPAPLSRIKNKHRYHLLLKGSSASQLHSFSRWLVKESKGRLQRNGVDLILDNSPQNFL